MSEFEQMLLDQCAPTIFGVKQANLFSCSKENKQEVLAELKRYNGYGSTSGMQFKILYECKNRIFIIAYRKKAMQHYFALTEAKEFLLQQGYPKTENIETLLQYLKYRIEKWEEFPHEIGLFLGYPLMDVKDFIAKKGLHFKFCGYWKVYSNEETAKKIFQRYEKCKEVIRYKVTKGIPLTELVGMTC